MGYVEYTVDAISDTRQCTAITKLLVCPGCLKPLKSSVLTQALASNLPPFHMECYKSMAGLVYLDQFLGLAVFASQLTSKLCLLATPKQRGRGCNMHLYTKLYFCHMTIMQNVTWLRSDWCEQIFKLPCQQAQGITQCTLDPFPSQRVESGDETTPAVVVHTLFLDLMS